MKYLIYKLDEYSTFLFLVSVYFNACAMVFIAYNNNGVLPWVFVSIGFIFALMAVIGKIGYIIFKFFK